MYARLFVVCAAFLLTARLAPAAENGEMTEAAQAQAEADAEAKLGEGEVPDYTGTGKLILGSPNVESPDVVGLFRTEKGGVLQVKLKDSRIQERLKSFNGKSVTLTGSLRNEGKYLVVRAILEPEQPPVRRKKKNGF